MAELTLKGEVVRTKGSLPAIGMEAPEFLLASTRLSNVRLSDFAGKRLIMNIFLTLEAVPCAESVRRFNEIANSLDNTEILCISKDLPFVQESFNNREGTDNVMMLSEIRNNDFGEQYGVRIADGPFAGFLARAVIVLDEKHRVIHTEIVSKVEEEPDYNAAIHASEKMVNGGYARKDHPPTESGIDEFCEKKPTGEHARLFDDDDACDESRSGKI
jgi:thioredoxin-dependent peroxiredoxin